MPTNYYPLVISSIKHKNDSSEDLYLYMGKQGQESAEDILQAMTPEELDKLAFEKRRL